MIVNPSEIVACKLDYARFSRDLHVRGDRSGVYSWN